MATDVIAPADDPAILARLVLPEGEELASAARGSLLLRHDQAGLDRIQCLNLVDQAGRFFAPGGLDWTSSAGRASSWT